MYNRKLRVLENPKETIWYKFNKMQLTAKVSVVPPVYADP